MATQDYTERAGEITPRSWTLPSYCGETDEDMGLQGPRASAATVFGRRLKATA